MCQPGAGLPIEPGLTFIPRKVPMQQTVSVWPYPSAMGRPVPSCQTRTTSGFRGSPALTQRRSSRRSNFSRSARISIR